MRDALLRFTDGLEAGGHDPRGYVLHHKGRQIASAAWAPYSLSRPHEMYSLSKSFTSMAMGFCVQQGFASLDDKVVEFFPDDLPAVVSPKLAAMRIRDLLSMVTGHAEDTTGHLWASEDGNWPKAFLSLPVVHEPGTFFLYNTGATYMVSAIVQRVSGMRVTQLLAPRLFEPLDIRYVWSTRDPKGVDFGGSGMRIAVNDIAKVGEVVRTNDGSRLPADYMTMATSFQVPNGGAGSWASDGVNDWNQGYGFQFWQCQHGAFRGDGAFGQFMLVLPEQEASLALFSSSENLQGILDLVYEHLMPALASGAESVGAHFARQVREDLAPVTRDWAGAYTFESNEVGLEALTIRDTGDCLEYAVQWSGQAGTLTAGKERWVEQVSPVFQWQPEAVCAKVGELDGRLALRLRFPEMTQSQTLLVAVVDGAAEVEFRCKNRFGRTEYPKVLSR